MDEIFEDPLLKWVAKEWTDNAHALALWAMRTLVNRFDVWGQYTFTHSVLGKKVSAVTLPRQELRGKKDMVSIEKLERHFKGKRSSDLIGLHCTSAEATCRWFAIDVDVHDEADTEEFARRNFEAVSVWHGKLRGMFFDPYVIDTNGMGSFHLWALLDKPYPLTCVYEFLKTLVSDYDQFGLKRSPEIFPSSPELKGLGKWLRLPGRHHTHAHYSRILNDDGGSEEWLEGLDAIDHLLSVRQTPLPDAGGFAAKRLPDTGHGKKRKKICVDLDGVIAAYDGWKGTEHIGPPIEGAREFLAKLAENYEVVIYSSRCSSDHGMTQDELLRIRNFIVGWLESNGLLYADVYAGTGKPLAYAFIDDRAVNCSPQTDPSAFERVLSRLKEMK